jgi:hypothetical protein
VIPDDLVAEWAGTDKKGGIKISPGDGEVQVTAYTGALSLRAGQPTTWKFSLLVTPVKPFDYGGLYNNRFFQDPYGKFTPTPLDDLEEMGANVAVVHQGSGLNRYINYPFLPQSCEPLKEHVQDAKTRGMRVKIYVRDKISRLSEP